MPRKATIVFVPVPVSMLEEVEKALRSRSVKLSDMAEAQYSHGDDDGYRIIKEVQRKLDRVLWWVITKKERASIDGKAVGING